MRRVLALMLCLMLLFVAHAEVWICPECGREAEGNFCPWCGTKRTWEIICPVCGAHYNKESGYTFCRNCGAVLPVILVDSVNVGDIVSFGHYEQDNDVSNGKENIEWIVLSKDEHTLRLISRYGLDCAAYNRMYASTNWEDCTLRGWLNQDFMNDAFSEKERALLLTENGVPGDNGDRVFLLNASDAETLFKNDDARQCQATARVRAKGVYADQDNNGWYWLSSSGDYSKHAARVLGNGTIDSYGFRVNFVGGIVRPMIMLHC